MRINVTFFDTIWLPTPRIVFVIPVVNILMAVADDVDDVVDRKVVEDKKVSIERSCIETSPIFQPSNIVTGQQKQNANNDEDESADIFLSVSCFHLHRYKTQKIYNCHLCRYKAQIIYKASYNLRQATKKNPPAAEIFSSNGLKFFA